MTCEVRHDLCGLCVRFSKSLVLLLCYEGREFFGCQIILSGIVTSHDSLLCLIILFVVDFGSPLSFRSTWGSTRLPRSPQVSVEIFSTRIRRRTTRGPVNGLRERSPTMSKLPVLTGQRPGGESSSVA